MSIEPITRRVTIDTAEEAADLAGYGFGCGLMVHFPDGTTVEGFVDGNDVAWVREDPTGPAVPITDMPLPSDLEFFVGPMVDGEIQLRGAHLPLAPSVVMYGLSSYRQTGFAVDGEGRQWILHYLPDTDCKILACGIETKGSGRQIIVRKRISELPLPITVIEVDQ